MPQDLQAARTFFEENFQPVRIARLGESEARLTGYFEPIVQGSRHPSPEIHVPLYRRPRDLVVAGQKAWILCICKQGGEDWSPQWKGRARAVLRPSRN